MACASAPTAATSRTVVSLGEGKFPVLASRFHTTFVLEMGGFHVHLVFRRLWLNVLFSQIIPHGSCALERGQITGGRHLHGERQL